MRYFRDRRCEDSDVHVMDSRPFEEEVSGAQEEMTIGLSTGDVTWVG